MPCELSSKEESGLNLKFARKRLDHQIASPKTNFLGLALTGFFEYFPYNQLQILDLCESEFIKRHGVEKDIIEKIFSYKIPAVVVVKNIEVPQMIIDTAGAHDIPLLRTSMEPGWLITELSEYMEEALAPSVVKHGVLMNVLGMGVLILGKSSIGKSECALELVKEDTFWSPTTLSRLNVVPEISLKGPAANLSGIIWRFAALALLT